MIVSAVSMARAQNITAAEYFVDTDPGVGNATAISVTPGTTVNINTNIPIASFGPGFHFLGIRTRGADGKWGLFELRGFYISQATTNGADINAVEYFIDSDPGVGNGTAVTITPGATVTFNTVVPIASLSNGFHFLAIRARGNDGKWGLFELRGFYISQSAANAADINAAEYFIDTDPGVGNATPIAVTPGATVNFTTPIPIASFSDGFHFLAIRTRGTDGKWGLFETRGFYISSATTNAPDINAAEYFIDTDPGLGNATSISVTAGAIVPFVAVIPIASFSPGFHFLAIRTRGSDGKWGLFEIRGFYISTQTNDAPIMVEAEYFIDADPGVGNGSPITVTAGASISENYALPIPGGTSQGSHMIAIRYVDASGKWGLFEIADFIVDGVLPLQFLEFNATRDGERVLLRWKTDNEVNTSHFDVERSFNGVDFRLIGTVSSANSPGVHDYQFVDPAPARGVNFYRLRQVDLDASADYSVIRRVYLGSEQSLQVYPNPVREKMVVQVDGSISKWHVSVYNARGELAFQQLLNGTTSGLLEIDMRRLAAGSYWVVLNNGLKTLSGRIIKQ
jgi:hypothetical protein